MKDRIYLASFLAAAGLLLFIGRDQLPAATFLTWGFTFAATTAAAVLIISLYRVQLELRESRHELARKDAELNFALEVQKALFPARLPQRSDLSFSAVCIPAQGISGDYYDVLECEGGRTVFAVADVSGKGISAAILMANVQAVLRTLLKTSESLSELCSELNKHLYEVTESSKFATFFIAQWLPDSGLLEYVNAGHQSPVLAGSADGIRLTDGGPPIGMFPDTDYRSGSLPLADSDLLVIYSDGISEAQSKDEVEFGDARISELVRSSYNLPLSSIKAKILEAVTDWAPGDPEDDMTIVLVRIGAETSGEEEMKE